MKLKMSLWRARELEPSTTFGTMRYLPYDRETTLGALISF